MSQEDEEFRRKIVDLHRKLSDVDEGGRSECQSPDGMKNLLESEPLKELEAVARRAEETSNRNSEELVAERFRQELGADVPKRNRHRKIEFQHDRKRQLEFLQRKSKRLNECLEDQSDDNTAGTSEMNFLNRLRIKRRSMKLLSFLSGKSAEKSQEERAARLLKMYMPEKSGAGRGQNTITIHHTSRDRRFWKLRSRRRSNSK